MKILLDLQGCQAIGSRHRGIGRYSLALARSMLQVGHHHEFHLLLNGAFPEAAASLTDEFRGQVPDHRIHVFRPPEGCAEIAGTAGWRTFAAEAIRRHVIRSVAPDVVHVSSLFEGLVDDSATAIDPALDGFPTAVTLYDLIPLLHRERYLADQRTAAWYARKIESVQKARLLLGISESACDEARASLDVGQAAVVNISSAADPRFFFPADPGDAPRRLGLRPGFIMYTGGIDWRKNIEGLVRAYAMLPAPMRATFQLVLVCQAEAYARTQVLALARDRGLGPDDVVFTGYVSDEDLASLYRACALFVFPSLHEGFGLPALEAMMCGAPVIGSGTTSIPEVIGRADALFDPRSDAQIAALIERALSDADFRESLRAHGPVQAARFTWELTASRALAAIEALGAQRAKPPATAATGRERPLLAVHTPLPPARSGIADYAAELLPALRDHYEIELVTDQPDVVLPAALQALPVRTVSWFRQNAARYDRILYQFGNSMFHAHMFRLLREHPGVVVLHDFFLSGVLNWMDQLGSEPGLFHEMLMGSHGAQAVREARDEGPDAIVLKYPMNGPVLRRAAGVIVHSRFAAQSADAWYGQGCSSHWRNIPHLRSIPATADRAAARAQLGLGPQDILVCSFGHIAPTKLNLEALRAWKASSLASDPRCHLVLVGTGIPPYGDDVAQAAAGISRTVITGFADRGLYEQYLAAADFALQLRTRSRGETSGAVLDCLAWGVPVVANANGSNAEYPPHVVRLLPDSFQHEELVAALEEMAGDAGLRSSFAAAGRQWVREWHDPVQVARQYRDAIESFAARPHAQHYWGAVSEIAGLPLEPSDADLVAAAVALEASFAPASGTAGGRPRPSASP